MVRVGVKGAMKDFLVVSLGRRAQGPDPPEAHFIAALYFHRFHKHVHMQRYVWIKRISSICI